MEGGNGRDVWMKVRNWGSGVEERRRRKWVWYSREGGIGRGKGGWAGSSWGGDHGECGK